MIENNITIKYWKEATSTTVHTLNWVQLKDSFKTPYELWYGYKPNVSYLKVFGSKCYILKESRKGKFDVKGDEGIFLGYSCRSKTYNCLNFSTHKIIESAHVRIDEFVEKVEEEIKKELEDYRRFVYYESDTLPGIFYDKETSYIEPSRVIELQVVHIESQGPKL